MSLLFCSPLGCFFRFFAETDLLSVVVFSILAIYAVVFKALYACFYNSSVFSNFLLLTIARSCYLLSLLYFFYFFYWPCKILPCHVSFLSFGPSCRPVWSVPCSVSPHVLLHLLYYPSDILTVLIFLLQLSGIFATFHAYLGSLVNTVYQYCSMDEGHDSFS